MTLRNLIKHAVTTSTIFVQNRCIILTADTYESGLEHTKRNTNNCRLHSWKIGL